MNGLLSKVLVKFTDKESQETLMLAMGSLLSNQQYIINSTNFNDFEFKIFSQWGDDGLIQYLIKNIEIKNRCFIEFGTGDYTESNTRFLMMHNNWSGFIIDADPRAIIRVRNSYWYWKYDLKHKTAFINKDNINDLLALSGFDNVGIVHIDLDGNDYHIFEAIDLSVINPSIVILEYNSFFGNKRCISIPYDPLFERRKAHYSLLYWGASLPALVYLATKRGYSLVGCNSAGNNAYFVKNDLFNKVVKPKDVKDAYQESKFRESRNEDRSSSFLDREKGVNLIKGLPIQNVVTGAKETL